MIFVTVGTTIPFDRLLRQVDELVRNRTIVEHVICQIGNSTYEPTHCEYFRFRPSIDDLIAQADLVITHGGSTVLLLLASQKRFIAVPNDQGADNHQLHFVQRVAEQTPLLWTADLSNLGDLIAAANSTTPQFQPLSSLADDLRAYLLSLAVHNTL